MIAISPVNKRAFVVSFRDLERWDVPFFQRLEWRWPQAIVRPVTEALVRKVVEVDGKAERVALPIIEKISFGGALSVTKPDERVGYCGRLFWADPGDLIFSKIRVKQGSLAIVSKNVGRLAVSAEYPVFEVNLQLADPDYLALVFRSAPFMRLLGAVSHGGSTKTRVPPAEFERQRIPLPPLSVQRKIIAASEAARAFAAMTAAKIERLEHDIEARFLADLGLKAPENATPPKAFAVQWKDCHRWSVGYNKQARAGFSVSRASYPLAEVGSLAEQIQYGTSEKANTVGSGLPVIRMNNLVEGELDLRNLKHVRLAESDAGKLALKDGDVLFNRTNSKELVGKCAVFHEQGEYVFASYLIRVRVDKARASPDFVAFALNSTIGRQQIDALSRQIIGQANVNSQELRSLQIPLPPLSVQGEMMHRVETRRAEIVGLKAATKSRAAAAKADVEAMILGIKPVE